MQKKYLNKYRNQSRRLQSWDYRNPGAYFITICTKDRQHFFGKCKEGKMELSTAGAIVQGFWYEITKHFNHVQLGEFIVMPNHLHGILEIISDDSASIDHTDADDDVGTRQCHVPTSSGDKRKTPGFYKKIVPKPGSVSVVIGSFKSICTKHIRKVLPELEFGWQERFHDHIIRNEESFIRISNYIINNPLNWKEDKFY